MKTFFVLDLDIYQREDFAEMARETKATKASVAASFGAEFEDLTDGARARVMVAEDRAGTDAKVYSVTQRIDIRYDVEETDDV